MKKSFVTAALVIAAGLVAAEASAADARGSWNTQGNRGRITIAPCGGVLCGTTTMAQPGKKTEKITILSNLTAAAPGTWRGSAFNPEDGQNYQATLTLRGDDVMVVRGCAGPFCKDEIWTRAK